MKSLPNRIIRLRRCMHLSVVCLLAMSACAEDAWWQADDAKSSAALAAVLGSDLAAWSTLDPWQRPTTAYGLAPIDGTTVLTATGPQPLTLRRNTRYPVNTEILVRFRIVPIEGKHATLTLTAGIKDLADAKEERIWMNFGGTGADNAVRWHLFDPVKDPQGRAMKYGTLSLDGIGQRSFSWPESLRRIVEQESASLRPLAQTWLSCRCQLRDQGYAVYLNEELLLERQWPDLDVTGMFELAITPGVELAAVRVSPLSAGPAVHLPVHLGHHLNAATIDGSSIQAASLPPAETTVTVAGVPFVFPAADERGNDHIDVGHSWFQAGLLEGHMYPQFGPFNGRWAGPMYVNPARIQFQVPSRRYRAIHLIAAADNEPDCVPVVTAQFFRPSAGFPANFSASVPAFQAAVGTITKLSVQRSDGGGGALYHVVIPIEPGQLEGFKDMDAVGLELTKQVKLYRGYPDPSFYSYHAAGRPSSVHVYAMTLELPRVEMTVEPANYAHIWTAPEVVGYTVKLRNRTGAPRRVVLDLATESFDGLEKIVQQQKIDVAAGDNETAVAFSFQPQRHGWHAVNFTLTDAEQDWHEQLSLAYLHADTRRRGDWDLGQGPYFGFWGWGGGHHTPGSAKETLAMGLAGAMGQGGTYETATPEVKALAERFGMATLKHFAGSDHYVTNDLRTDLRTMSEEDAVAKMIESLRKIETKPSKITQTRYISFFPEPHLGAITSGSLPSYFGEPRYELSEQEDARFQEYLKALLIGGPAVKKHWPDAKIMLPHGDPMFTVFFLRNSEAARKLIDGVAVDIPVFERLPEQQTHQVAIHRLWQCKEEYRKAGREDLLLPMYEGPCIPDQPGAVPADQAANLLIRDSLMLIGYGVNQLVGSWGAFAAGNYWGEQHYGGGVLERLPLERPKPMYAAFATLTRQLNRRNFSKWLPTGSLSVYCMQFKHAQDGSLVHVLWTIRGRRPVRVQAAEGAALELYDAMDNATKPTVSELQAGFEISPSPVFLHGLTADAVISLGEPDHGDATPAEVTVALGNFGDGSWQTSAAEDPTYADNSIDQIRRFPGNMSVAPVADAHQGAAALAVTLGAQPVARLIMPYYTTLVPAQPLTIPGKASHLGVWVRAASDWGRIVYSLRDAAGERWISVGTKGEWNCDDTHNWSSFCFDGWRYLRFELPANSPYDAYREYGSTWWGHFGAGDGIVDLPLQLEKVFVERRTHVIYVNDLQPARSDDVLLGALFAEYAAPDDATPQAVALGKLRAPVPSTTPALGNPLTDLAATATLPALAAPTMALPDQHADGTQCHVHFTPVAGYASYDVWVSPYADGTGALCLGGGWTEPGKLLGGLRPETDFFLFLVAKNEAGAHTQPSPALQVRLQDIFGMK